MDAYSDDELVTSSDDELATLEKNLLENMRDDKEDILRNEVPIDIPYAIDAFILHLKNLPLWVGFTETRLRYGIKNHRLHAKWTNYPMPEDSESEYESNENEENVDIREKKKCSVIRRIERLFKAILIPSDGRTPGLIHIRGIKHLFYSMADKVDASDDVIRTWFRPAERPEK